MKKLIYLLSFIALIAIIGCSGGSDSTMQSNAGDTVKTSSVTFSANFNKDSVNAAFLSDIKKIRILYYTNCKIETIEDYKSMEPYIYSIGYDKAIRNVPWIKWDYDSYDCSEWGEVILDRDNNTVTISTMPGYAKFGVIYYDTDNISESSGVEQVITAGFLEKGDNNVEINSLRGTWKLSTPIDFNILDNQSVLGSYALPFASLNKLHIPGNEPWLFNLQTSDFDPKKPAEVYNYYSVDFDLTLDNGSRVLYNKPLYYINQFLGGVDNISNQNAITTEFDEFYKFRYFDNVTNSYKEVGFDILGFEPFDDNSMTPMSYVDGDKINGVIAEYVDELKSFDCRISIDGGKTWIEDIDNVSCGEVEVLTDFNSNIYTPDIVVIGSSSIKKYSNKRLNIASIVKIDDCDNITTSFTGGWNKDLCYDATIKKISEPDWYNTKVSVVTINDCIDGYTYFDNYTGSGPACVNNTYSNVYYRYIPTCQNGTYYPYVTTIYEQDVTLDIYYCTHSFTADRLPLETLQ